MAEYKSHQDDALYQEFARKMALIEDGPTTTNFDQLTAAGIQLPEPGSIPDADMRTKLWEVLAGLAKLRVYLENTDHLSDRELYAKLWHEILRTEVPAIDEIGFDNCVQLLSSGDDAENFTYLKYFADAEWRRFWLEDNPDCVMPPQEDPPYKRDCLLPWAHHAGLPEAADWLRANWSRSALASNRFGNTERALKFVEDLYAAGATTVAIDEVMMPSNHNWTPYADTLIVQPPDDPARRRELFAFMREVGQPDEDGPDPVEEVLLDSGQKFVRLSWD
jgi:hypothetical protein